MNGMPSRGAGVKQVSDKKLRLLTRSRDILLYFLIAFALVGTELVGLARNWPRPSLRLVGCILSTMILAIYLIKIFRSKVRSVQFWAALVLLLAFHLCWALVAPFLIVMIGLGVELALFGIVLRHFLMGRN